MSTQKRATGSELLGHRMILGGPTCAVIMNDWLADTGTWDSCERYLDRARVSWCFADLRGYGRSRGLDGPYSADQAATDVVALADQIGLDRFVIVGHSMSSIVALRLAQTLPDRIIRAIVVTPPPMEGGAPAEIIASAKSLAVADDDGRTVALRQMWGSRLSESWISAKVEQWRSSSASAAVTAYVEMFMKVGLPDRDRRIQVPVVAITGEADPNQMMRSSQVGNNLASFCQDLSIVPLSGCGHYPMQEIPPLFATVMERLITEGTLPEVD